MSLTGRVLKSVTLKYNTASRQPEAVRRFLTPFGDAMILLSPYPETPRRRMEPVSRFDSESPLTA